MDLFECWVAAQSGGCRTACQTGGWGWCWVTWRPIQQYGTCAWRGGKRRGPGLASVALAERFKGRAFIFSPFALNYSFENAWNLMKHVGAFPLPPVGFGSRPRCQNMAANAEIRRRRREWHSSQIFKTCRVLANISVSFLPNVQQWTSL